jgi:hypothetical protein
MLSLMMEDVIIGCWRRRSENFTEWNIDGTEKIRLGGDLAC